MYTTYKLGFICTKFASSKDAGLSVQDDSNIILERGDGELCFSGFFQGHVKFSKLYMSIIVRENVNRPTLALIIMN